MLSSLFSFMRDAIARSKPPRSGSLGEMLHRNWYLGFTSFGGPAVHFQIVSALLYSVKNLQNYQRALTEPQFRQLFVEKLEWIDGQMVWPRTLFSRALIIIVTLMSGKQYKELFALCQALPGPGSTKMLYCINVIRCGIFAGLLSFFVWRYSP